MKLLAAIAVGVWLGLAGAAPAAQRTTLHGNNFYANCRLSHTNDDDPIVYPGHPGWSHAHTYFGNRSTDARSTLPSLRRAETTCKPTADKAAYWVPTLFDGQREVRPAKGQFYFNLRGYDQMRAFPAGLRMIAGDSHARSPQSPRVAYWACGGRGGVTSAPLSRVPLSCANVPIHVHKGFFKPCAGCPSQQLPRPAHVRTYLELHVNFPDCWDGVHLDSSDHKSHMAYSRGYVCPASHPVKVPLIRLMVRYPIAGGRDVHLSSGGQLTAHADFINAWDERFLTKLVDECFHDRPCDPEAMSP